MENNSSTELEKLKELIEEVQIAMLCTKYENKLQARPMSTAKVDEDGSIWFFTNEYSCKAEQVEDDPEVCLAYSSPSKNSYVSVLGKAQLVDDKTRMEEFWNPAVKAWFPQGLEDAKLVLLKVKPYQAEYWDSSSSKMVTLFNMLKAVVTGEKYDEGEHGKINL
ncbi:pyridoxamine 5'-phosphate oxidase family protein [Rubrolithibacter danxiaensis]|uniref:pyridoxamine 5'-phosphate oxidase family protein n=1 Tax=Rubrolithibacter danxiaensis TaxID=3390805 RepID=UPI003BF91AB3